MGWTEERVEFLKAHWALGESATHIARQLGGVTRNAVLGKIHRMGLAERHKASKPAKPSRIAKPPSPRAPRPVTLRLAGNATVFHEPPDPRPPRVVAPLKEEGPGLATAETLGAYQCKWPIGDPQHADFTHCGRRAADGPYCDDHRAVAYTPASVKKRPNGNELARSLRRYV